MFSIFRKRRYLADLLGDFVDIHNHILPGIDDGAQNVEESLALIRGFGELGINRFVATPHIHPLYPNTPESIANAHNKLMSALMDHQITNVVVETAAEHMIDENFDFLLGSKKIMKMGPNHLLVEISFLQPPINFKEVISGITQSGLHPILAHPERYSSLNQKSMRITDLKKMGVLFQLNMLSLGGFYGKEIQKMAYSLLENGYSDFLGSDVHSMKHLRNLKMIHLSNRQTEHLNPVINRTIQNFY